MSQSQSPHLTNIPEAVRIAGSLDPGVDPGLKTQAVEYLTQVKDLCEETWQVSRHAAPLNISGWSKQVEGKNIRVGYDQAILTNQSRTAYLSIYRELVLLVLRSKVGMGNSSWRRIFECIVNRLSIQS
jgi:hypothetical protein